MNIKNKALILWMIMFSCCLTVFSKPMRAFPNDTLRTFITNYGKDSLLHLIDERILAAKIAIVNNPKPLYDNYTYMQLMLVSNEFQLGLDTVIFSNVLQDSIFFSLYNRYYGDTSWVMRIIDTVRARNFDMSKVYLQNIRDYNNRIAMACFCTYLPVKNFVFDSLYAITNKMKTDDKIHVYWVFSEYSRKCGDKNSRSVYYRPLLFKSIYKSNNLGKICLAYDPVIPSKKPDPFYAGNAIQLLAYGLYGGDATLDKYGKDVMYLLHTQLQEGSWPKFYKSGDLEDIRSTFYALWALCETREQLKKYK